MKKNYALLFVFSILFAFNPNHSVIAQINAGADTAICSGSVTLNAVVSNALSTTSYTLSDVPYNPDDYTAGTAVTLTDDAGTPMINIGFTFCFYGNTFTQFSIHSNNFITFNSGQTGNFYTLQTLPNTATAAPKNAIMGPWQDINPAAGGTIKYAVYGTAPFRRLVVAYYQVPMYSCNTQLYSSQIIIYETTNIIETHILNKYICTSFNNGNAVHGIHNGNGTAATVVPGRNRTQWTTTNEGKRFTPSGINTASVEWFQGTTSIGTGNSVSVSPTVATDYIAQGTYSCNNAVVRDTVRVTIGLSHYLTPTNVSCSGGSNGKVVVTGTGGTPPYSFAWSNAATGDTISNLTAGLYSVTITDANSCTGSSSVTLTQPAPLTHTSTVTQVTCNGAANGTATVIPTGGTAPYNYVWSNLQLNGTATGLAPGIYQVAIADSKGCTRSGMVTITQPSALTSSVTTQTNVACNSQSNGSATVAGGGGTSPYTYTWSVAQTGPTATGLAAGQYGVTVTDANLCTRTQGVTITQPAILNATTTMVVPVSCGGANNGQASATATGGTGPYSYAWSSGATTALATGLGAGNYTVTATDSKLCTTTATISMINPSFNSTVLVMSDVRCNGNSNGSAAVTVTGGASPISYLWSNAETTAVATQLTAGNHSVTITDANLCSITNTVSITEPAVFSLVVNSKANINCNGAANGYIAVLASGGTPTYSYLWSNAATADSIFNLQPGTYGCTATDSKGCTASISETLTQPTPLSVNVTSTNLSCSGGNSGTASATVTGGVGPYGYLWSNSATTANISNLSASVYNLVVTDANSCTSGGIATITSPASLSISLSANSQVLCFGGNTGSASATVTGGNSPYSYSWSNSQTASTATGLIAGSFIVTVTDGNLCTTTGSIAITQPAALGLTMSVDSTICIGMSVAISASVTGGSTPLTYAWSNGWNNPTQTVAPVSTTLYSVTVTDNNGCSVSSSGTNITVRPPLSVTASPDQSVCSGANATISATGTGGNGNLTYTWSNGSTGAGPITVNPTVTTTYIVTLTDGCGTPAAKDTVIITVLPMPVLAFTSTPNTGCAPHPVSFTNTSSISAGTLTYLWSFGDGSTATQLSPTRIYASAGSYSVTLTATSSAGCSLSMTSSQNITVNSTPVAAATENLNIPSVSFTNNSTGATSFQWAVDGTVFSTDSNPTYSFTTSGEHAFRLVVTNANGCKDTLFITIPVLLTPMYYIPNVFTPNGDMFNDVFRVQTLAVNEFQCKLYNRWGKFVYEWSGLNGSWDGKLKSGAEAADGAYFYEITLLGADGITRNEKGQVMLIR